jgi:DNA-directed RNA polymerase specialized sigma24 family protein
MCVKGAGPGPAVERYDRALAVLRPEEGELVVARVEFGFSNGELARAFGKSTPNAARMALQRALLRLAAEMKKG